MTYQLRVNVPFYIFDKMLICVWYAWNLRAMRRFQRQVSPGLHLLIICVWIIVMTILYSYSFLIYYELFAENGFLGILKHWKALEIPKISFLSMGSDVRNMFQLPYCVKFVVRWFKYNNDYHNKYHNKYRNNYHIYTIINTVISYFPISTR